MDFNEIHGFPVGPDKNPQKNTKLPDLTQDPTGIHLCFTGNLWISWKSTDLNGIHGFP